MKRITLLLVCLLMIGAGVAYGWSLTKKEAFTVKGRVVDVSNHIILSGAEITIKNLATGEVQSLKATELGEYSVTLKVGQGYSLVASAFEYDPSPEKVFDQKFCNGGCDYVVFYDFELKRQRQ